MIDLIPTFGNALWTLAAFFIALSVIVAIHEFGHYIVGRWTGIQAEVFSLGFGPVLFSREDRRGTRWQVAALPLGGYVKFLGDSDAASGRDAAVINTIDEADLRQTMHGAPLWARSATVAAGPVFNFALSILVFSVVLMIRGIAAEPLTVGELRPMPGQVGLEVGDVVRAIEGRPTPPIEEFEFVGGRPAPALAAVLRRRAGWARGDRGGSAPLPSHRRRRLSGLGGGRCRHAGRRRHPRRGG